MQRTILVTAVAAILGVCSANPSTVDAHEAPRQSMAAAQDVQPDVKGMSAATTNDPSAEVYQPTQSEGWSPQNTTARFLENYAANWVVTNTRMTISDAQINSNWDTILVTASRSGSTYYFYFDTRYASGRWSVVTPPRSIR